MKVLLLGGTGVLSQPVYEQCRKCGYDTYVLNRGNRKLPDMDKDHLFMVDLHNTEDVIKSINGNVFDVVIDFLSYTPKQLNNTLTIFHNHMKQYIFISSATAYQINDDSPITENRALVDTGWKYAVDKHTCETIVKSDAEKNKYEYTIIRPYVTYGETRVPFALCKRHQQWSVVNRIINGKPILMWDDGNAICPLLYADDFAVGAVGLINNKKAFGEAFHITSDNRYTWNDVVKTIGSIVGNNSPSIFYLPSNTLINEFSEYGDELTGDKSRSYNFDNTKIKEVVPEFSCTTSLQDGLTKVLNYYDNNSKNKRIDFYWDGSIDRVIKKYCKDQLIRKKAVYIPDEGNEADDYKQYRKGSSNSLHCVKNCIIKAKQFLKKILK